MQFDEEKVSRILRKWAKRDQDLYQVGWLVVLEAIADFNPSRGLNFVSFALKRAAVEMWRHQRVYRSAVTTPKKYARRAATESETPWGDSLVESIDSRMPGPDDVLMLREVQLAMQVAMNQLSDRHRHIIECWLQCGNQLEVVRLLGIRRQEVNIVINRFLNGCASEVREEANAH